MSNVSIVNGFGGSQTGLCKTETETQNSRQKIPEEIFRPCSRTLRGADSDPQLACRSSIAPVIVLRSSVAIPGLGGDDLKLIINPRTGEEGPRDEDKIRCRFCPGSFIDVGR